MKAIKKILVLLPAALILGASFSANAATLPVSSRTQFVTAYQGLALVMRKIELPQLAAGAHEILIPDLPVGLNPDSLGVKGSGQARIKIHHLQLKPLEDGADPALATLEKQIEGLSQRLARVNNQQELNQTHQTLAETLRQQLQTRAQDAENSLSAREWQELVTLALTHTQQVLDTQTSTAEQKAELERQLQKLQARLQEMQQSLKPRQQASLYITVESPGSATLMVSYLIGGVGWQPAYEARLDSSQKKLNLIYLGDLSQRSGESWDGVQLTLSTVTPMLNQRPPQPQNWVIGQQPLYDQRTRTTNMPARAEGAGLDAMAKLAEREVNYAQSEIQSTGISVRFQLPESQSVPSSTQTRRLAMATREFATNASYRIIPRQSPLAFLEAEIKNESGLPLLPGPMRSYLGEEFTGSQPIDLIRPGQSARLNFGVDQDIKVGWKEVEREKRNVGVLGDKEELTLHYEAEITNFKPIGVELRIQEPLPISGDENITVEQVKAEPAPTTLSSDKKLQTWQIKAQPWEKKTIRLSYKVTYPKGMVIYL